MALLIQDIQDLEFENALVKTQLAEVIAMKELEVGELKKKLGLALI